MKAEEVSDYPVFVCEKHWMKVTPQDKEEVKTKPKPYKKTCDFEGCQKKAVFKVVRK